MSTTPEHIAAARALGQEAGRVAASWVQDGNTSPEHIARVLAMLDNGDPAADQYLPARPDLSGEYAGDPTPATLFEEVTGRTWAMSFALESDHDALIDAIAEAWEQGVADTFESECERILRNALAD